MITWLKAKYKWKPRSRYGAVGDHNNPKQKKLGNVSAKDVIPTRERVLFIGPNFQRSWKWRERPMIQ